MNSILTDVMQRVQIAIFLCGFLTVACSGDAPRMQSPATVRPVAPVVDVDGQGGTGQRGPGTLYNACERIWCLTHQRNYDLDHFLTGHVGWILHDDGSGDVFVPKHRESGPAFPHARVNVLALCGAHVHPYWLGAHMGPVTKSGFNAALGYSRVHFTAYGTRLAPAVVNREAWGFLHAATPKEFRFGDLTSAAEMAGSGWQKAFPARPASGAALVSGPP